MNEFALKGVDGLVDEMSKLADNVQRRYATKAARAGANKIRDAARSNAARVDDPQTPDNIEKNIVTHAMGKRFVPDGVGMRVGVLGGAQEPDKAGAVRAQKANPGGDTFYWRFLEFGTAHAKAEPFMRPAMESEQTAALDALAASLQQSIFGR